MSNQKGGALAYGLSTDEPTPGTMYNPKTHIIALRLWVTVNIKKISQISSYLYLHKGSSYEAETK
jgi:hypothetical protein